MLPKLTRERRLCAGASAALSPGGIALNSELDIGKKECTFERNVCLIVSLLPFFKVIIIGDLDLTQDLRYVPISKIIGNVNAI